MPARISRYRPAEFTAAGLRDLMAVNVMGTAACLEALMPRMMARRQGRIAVVASVAGYRGLPTSAYYGATKAALINLTESLKFDLDQAGVTIQLIDPGFVKTPLTDRNDFPMPFLISAELAADRIARGLRSRQFEIAFPRVFVAIMKLLRCLPYALYFPLVGRSDAAMTALLRRLGCLGLLLRADVVREFVAIELAVGRDIVFGFLERRVELVGVQHVVIVGVGRLQELADARHLRTFEALIGDVDRLVLAAGGQ